MSKTRFSRAKNFKNAVLHGKDGYYHENQNFYVENKLIPFYRGKDGFYQEKHKFYIENELFYRKNIRNAVLPVEKMVFIRQNRNFTSKTNFSREKKY